MPGRTTFANQLSRMFSVKAIYFAAVTLSLGSVAGLLVLALSTSANAQVAGATLSGLVEDSSGAFIPNANVSVNNL